MKKEDIDKLIEQSLSEEETQYYHELEEEGIFKQWGGLYKGKLGGWAILISIVQIILTVLTIWVGFNFFTSSGTENLILWGAGMFIGLMMVGQMKLWHWMQMDKNSILREMKRLEFQIALLSDKITKN